MFILLRRIERWLHQHVFKVGWLVTHDYQTTTILYYTFFLPGVFIHELIYWLVAGALGVHAERSLEWPDQQEIGELKLNFVQISNRAGVMRKAFISAAPMIFGLVFIWYIAANVFDIMTVVGTMSSGRLADVSAGFQLLIGAPLFWLWAYIIFTVANTMYPTVPKDLRGWRTIFLGIGAVIIVVLLLGIGGQVFEVLQSPLSNIIAVMQTILFLMISIDILMVLALGTIEYTIERITGHSATIQGGKLVTVTRQEAIEEREKQRERERRREERRRNRAAATGPSSVYLLAFSIPGAPGEEAITQVIEETVQPAIEEKPEEKKEEAPTRLPLFGGLAEGDKQETQKQETEEDKQRKESIAARINIPERRAPVPPPPQSKPEEKETDKQSQASTIGDDVAEEKDKPVAKPPAASSFGKPITRPKPAETSDGADEDKADEKLATPAASRFTPRPQPTLFGESDKDEEQEDKPKTPAVSRFGSTFGRPKPTETSSEDDKEAEDKPATPAASRFTPRPQPTLFGESDKDEEQEDKPKTPAVSRFGSTFGRPKPTETSSEDDKEAEDKPATPAASHVSSRPQPTLFGDDKDEEQEDKPKTPAASRFASTFGRPKTPEIVDEEETQDNEDDVLVRPAVVVGRPATASRLTGLDDEDDKNEEETVEKPVSFVPQARRFGTSTDDEDEEETSKTSRFGASPFSRPTDADSKRPAPSLGSFSRRKAVDDEEDEDEQLESSFLRQSRGKDAVSSLFSQLDDDDDSEDKDDESISSSFSGFRRPTMGSSTSRFGASRPAPKPISGFDDDNDDEVENDLVYEDVDDEYLDDDEYYDDDDEEYIDYDD